MKTIRNTSNRPLRVTLPRGKVLHLGPRSSGQVHPDALERPSVKKLIEAGDIEVVDDAEARHDTDGASNSNLSTHGHPPGTRARRTGDR